MIGGPCRTASRTLSEEPEEKERYGCSTLISCSSLRYAIPRIVALIVSRNFGPKEAELKKLLKGSLELSFGYARMRMKRASVRIPGAMTERVGNRWLGVGR